MIQQQNPDGSWSASTPLPWMEEHNRWQRLVLWILRRPHCSDEALRRELEGKVTHAKAAGAQPSDDEQETTRDPRWTGRDGVTAERDALRQDLRRALVARDDARAEVERLRAKVARVEALVDDRWSQIAGGHMGDCSPGCFAYHPRGILLSQIMDALADPEPQP